MSEAFNLEELVDITTDSFFDQAVGKQIRLGAYICPEVQSSFLGEAEALRQTLVLLLENAMEHTKEGRILVSVEPDPEELKHGAILITVSDTGSGIAPTLVERLNAFFRGEDNSVPEEASLAVVKQNVALMGGTLGVKSVQGKGAEFWFTTRFQIKPCGGHCKGEGDHDHDHDH